MNDPAVTVAVPTLSAGEKLAACVASLERQTEDSFRIVVVDNSGSGLARRCLTSPVEIIEMERNVGFGAAVNQAIRRYPCEFLATLNDDAVAAPDWLRSLKRAMLGDAEAGMCASQVRLFGEDRLDSAGMLMCADGSSKQRGHLEPWQAFPAMEDVLLPSGSAALYRAAMLREIGLFDEDFFLYCEDTDLGLRARRAGWRCLYVPQAVVEHHYSQSAGGASPLKAYYVERNRLQVAIRNFPARALPRAAPVALARYFWHAWYMLRGRGVAARFAEGGSSPALLALLLCRAHLAVLGRLGRLWRERRAIRKTARLSSSEFIALLRKHRISAREVARL